MEAIQHLIQLLATSNRDTLHTLMQFLSNVAAQSADHRTADNEWITGNKMDRFDFRKFGDPARRMPIKYNQIKRAEYIRISSRFRSSLSDAAIAMTRQTGIMCRFTDEPISEHHSIVETKQIH